VEADAIVFEIVQLLESVLANVAREDSILKFDLDGALMNVKSRSTDSKVIHLPPRLARSELTEAGRVAG